LIFRISGIFGEIMSIKTPATISVILTIFFLIFLAVVLLLFEMVALNGASERQGLTAIGLSLACQGVVMILAGIFARWLTNFLITKATWNNIMAVATAVLVTASIGGAISFLSMIIAIPVAGIR
jgi:hypothetical protein